ncbi:MAG: hypothetical protein MZV64_00265 [Ignavibacteriales bacterium]|nr:hypothetical protein [Ignavibacteriales bacterium]
MSILRRGLNSLTCFCDPRTACTSHRADRRPAVHLYPAGPRRPPSGRPYAAPPARRC